MQAVACSTRYSCHRWGFRNNLVVSPYLTDRHILILHQVYALVHAEALVHIFKVTESTILPCKPARESRGNSIDTRGSSTKLTRGQRSAE